MNYLVGSAIKFKAEVDVVAETTITLFKIIRPDGADVSGVDDEPMAFDVSETKIASVVWQSIAGTHPAGRYKYLVKAVNGGYTNIADGHFNLEEQP